LDELQRLATTDREVDDVALLGEQPLEEPTQPGIVLDDEHVHVLVLRPVSEGSLKGQGRAARSRAPPAPLRPALPDPARVASGSAAGCGAGRHAARAGAQN